MQVQMLFRLRALDSMRLRNEESQNHLPVRPQHHTEGIFSVLLAGGNPTILSWILGPLFTLLTVRL